MYNLLDRHAEERQFRRHLQADILQSCPILRWIKENSRRERQERMQLSMLLRGFGFPTGRAHESASYGMIRDIPRRTSCTSRPNPPQAFATTQLDIGLIRATIGAADNTLSEIFPKTQGMIGGSANDW